MRSWLRCPADPDRRARASPPRAAAPSRHSCSSTDRTGFALASSEAVATFGLVVVIAGTARSGRAGTVAPAAGAYIAAAIYFTSSTSFANPAVTLARVLTDTVTGIGPAAVGGFLAGQLAGALGAAARAARLFAPRGSTTDHRRRDATAWPRRVP